MSPLSTETLLDIVNSFVRASNIYMMSSKIDERIANDEENMGIFLVGMLCENKGNEEEPMTRNYVLQQEIGGLTLGVEKRGGASKEV